MMDKIPEEKKTIENHYHVVQKQYSPEKTIDIVMVMLLVIVAISVIATYFIDFNVEASIDLKKATTQTIWLAFSTFCVGELAKRIFHRKGKKTKAYEEAEAGAIAAIKTLNESVDSEMIVEYCEEVTETTIDRYRTHLLVSVGISKESFEKNYLGKDGIDLCKRMLKKEISYLQFRALRKCNKIRTKPYNPNFITSYSARDNAEFVPSENFIQRKDAYNTLYSVLFSISSASGVGFIFYDMFVSFSAEAVFMAIIKIIIMAVIFALKSTFGWNLAIMEIERNRLRESEAIACKKWAKIKSNEVTNG